MRLPLSFVYTYEYTCAGSHSTSAATGLGLKRSASGKTVLARSGFRSTFVEKRELRPSELSVALRGNVFSYLMTAALFSYNLLSSLITASLFSPIITASLFYYNHFSPLVHLPDMFFQTLSFSYYNLFSSLITAALFSYLICRGNLVCLDR